MSEPKITVDHLLGMNAIVSQLDLKYHRAKKFATENPEQGDDPVLLQGFRNAYWSANHTFNETLVNTKISDRPTYDAFKEAISK